MDAVIVSDCSNGENNTFIYRYIGPYKIAHVCRSQGYSAQVIDFVMSMDYDTLLGYLRKFVDHNTKMVALSATFLCQVPAKQSDGTWARAPEHVIKALRQIKLEFPQARYVLGGYMAEHLDGFGFIDCRVLSNAEGTTPVTLTGSARPDILTGGSARFLGAVASSSRQVLRAAAGAPAVQAAADGGGLRPLLPDRALLPRRRPAR